MAERPGEGPAREAPAPDAPAPEAPAPEAPPPEAPAFEAPAGATPYPPPGTPGGWYPPGPAPGGWYPPPLPPPTGWHPAYGYPPPPPRPRPSGPSNDVAVAGFCLSVTAAVLLLFTTGIASPLTLILAIVGMVLSRRGRGRVDRGETDRHRDLAQAGFIVGIVALALSVLALLFWAAIAVVAILAEQSSSRGPNPGGLDPIRAAVLALSRR